MANIYRNANQNPFLLASKDNEIVRLPNLLNANRYHFTPVPVKGIHQLDVENMGNPTALSKLHFEKQTQHRNLQRCESNLQRSESFYHDALECQGAFVAQRICNGA